MRSLGLLLGIPFVYGNTPAMLDVAEWSYKSVVSDWQCNNNKFFGLQPVDGNCAVDTGAAAAGAGSASRYCAATNTDHGDYLQACFSEEMIITEVIVQKGMSFQYPMNARVYLQAEGSTAWHGVAGEQNFGLAYDGVRGTACQEHIPFLNEADRIATKCVRVHPTYYQGHKSFRLGFMGYAAGEDIVVDPVVQHNTFSMGLMSKCMLDGAGRMKCAGKDGFPWSTSQQFDIQIPPCDKFKAIGLNAYFSCGVLESGEITCSPGLSAGDWSVRDSRNFKAVSPGWYFQCGILDNGDATCFGGGHGATYFPQSAGWVTRPGPFAKVSGGTEYACGLKMDGTIECWGQINQLTNPNQGGFSMSIDHGNSRGVIEFPGKWIDMDMHSYGLCAIKSNGQIECYGRNDNDVGDYIPTDAGGYSAISLGYGAKACAIKASDGTLDCFGLNVLEGTPTDTGFKMAFMATNAACAMKSDDSIVCWGENQGGVLDEPVGPSAQDMEDAGCPAPAFECVCENGNKADDSTCTADGDSNCESCDDNFGLEGKACEPLYSCTLYPSKKFCPTDHCVWGGKDVGCEDKPGGSGLTSDVFCAAIKPKRICDGFDNCMFWFKGGKTCISSLKLTQAEICDKTHGKKNCKGPDCAFNSAQKRCMLPSENSCELYTKKAHCNKNPCVNGRACSWNAGNCEGGGAC